jgi:hypothetical protein
MIREEVMATKNKKIKNKNIKQGTDTKILNQFSNQTKIGKCLEIDTKP